jgi:hypothetical protein
MTTLPNVQLGEGPDYNSIPVYNAGTAAIPANVPLALDTSNLLDSAGTNNQIAVVTPTGARVDIIGWSKTIIPATDSGRMLPVAPIVLAKCDAAGVAANVQVTVGTTSPYTTVSAASTGSASCGLSLASGASGEFIPMLLRHDGYAR